MIERQIQEPSVSVQKPGEEPFLRLPDPSKDHGSRAGDHGHRHDEGGGEAIGDGQRHREQQLSDRSVCKHHRQEDADGRQRGGHNGVRNLFRTLHARPGGRNSALAKTHDVFHDDDGVVDQHSDSERKAGKGHDIQAQVRKVHEHHGKQDRQRNADADHQCRPHVPKEQGKDNDRKERAEHHRREKVLHNERDVASLVHQVDDVEILILARQLIEGGIDSAGNHVRARSGALENGKDDRVVPVQSCVVFVGVVDDGYVRNIGQADDADPLDVRKKRRLDILRRAVLLADLQKPGIVLRVVNIARRHGKVLGINQL